MKGPIVLLKEVTCIRCFTLYEAESYTELECERINAHHLLPILSCTDQSVPLAVQQTNFTRITSARAFAINRPFGAGFGTVSVVLDWASPEPWSVAALCTAGGS